MDEPKTVAVVVVTEKIDGASPPVEIYTEKTTIPGAEPPGGQTGGGIPPDTHQQLAWDLGVHRNPDNERDSTVNSTAGLETAGRLRDETTHIPVGQNGAYLVGSTGGLRKRLPRGAPQGTRRGRTIDPDGRVCSGIQRICGGSGRALDLAVN